VSRVTQPQSQTSFPNVIVNLNLDVHGTLAVACPTLNWGHLNNWDMHALFPDPALQQG